MKYPVNNLDTHSLFDVGRNFLFGKMSQKLWVKHQAAERTFGVTRVSIDSCEYVHDFKAVIRSQPELLIPQKLPITLYQADGTEIDDGASPADYLQGNSRATSRLLSLPVLPINVSCSCPSFLSRTRCVLDLPIQ